MPPTPRSTSSTPKAPPKRRSTGERDRARTEAPVDRDPVLERHERTKRARYDRQRQRAIDAGEPTSVGEALDQAYDAGFDKGAKQSAKQPAGDRARSSLSSLPAGSLGIGSMVAPLLVETILITADEFIRFRRWPVPSRYLAAFFVFGGLSLASDTQAARAASVTAWGLVLATTYAFASRGSDVLAGVGNFFGGSPSSATSTTSAPAGAATTGGPATTAQVQPVA